MLNPQGDICTLFNFHYFKSGLPIFISNSVVTSRSFISTKFRTEYSKSFVLKYMYHRSTEKLGEDSNSGKEEMRRKIYPTEFTDPFREEVFRPRKQIPDRTSLNFRKTLILSDVRKKFPFTKRDFPDELPWLSRLVLESEVVDTYLDALEHLSGKSGKLNEYLYIFLIGGRGSGKTRLGKEVVNIIFRSLDVRSQFPFVHVICDPSKLPVENSPIWKGKIPLADSDTEKWYSDHYLLHLIGSSYFEGETNYNEFWENKLDFYDLLDLIADDQQIPRKKWILFLQIDESEKCLFQVIQCLRNISKFHEENVKYSLGNDCLIIPIITGSNPFALERLLNDPSCANENIYASPPDYEYLKRKIMESGRPITSDISLIGHNTSFDCFGRAIIVEPLNRSSSHNFAHKYFLYLSKYRNSNDSISSQSISNSPKFSESLAIDEFDKLYTKNPFYCSLLTYTTGVPTILEFFIKNLFNNLPISLDSVEKANKIYSSIQKDVKSFYHLKAHPWFGALLPIVYFNEPVTRHTMIGEYSLDEILPSGLIFLQTIEDVEDNYLVYIPPILLQMMYEEIFPLTMFIRSSILNRNNYYDFALEMHLISLKVSALGKRETLSLGNLYGSSTFYSNHKIKERVIPVREAQEAFEMLINKNYGVNRDLDGSKMDSEKKKYSNNESDENNNTFMISNFKNHEIHDEIDFNLEFVVLAHIFDPPDIYHLKQFKVFSDLSIHQDQVSTSHEKFEIEIQFLEQELNKIYDQLLFEHQNSELTVAVISSRDIKGIPDNKNFPENIILVCGNEALNQLFRKFAVLKNT